MGAHTLITTATCPDCHHDDLELRPLYCLVCDGGLGICSTCGAAEADLSDHPTCEAYQELVSLENRRP